MNYILAAKVNFNSVLYNLDITELKKKKELLRLFAKENSSNKF